MFVHNIDARQIHQQAMLVNQDRSVEVAEVAELAGTDGGAEPTLHQ